MMRSELFAPQVIRTGDCSTRCFVAASDDHLASFLHTRAEFFDRLEVLMQAGLSLQNAWTLFKTKASSDWTWIARTVGIPTLVAQRMDLDIGSRGCSPARLTCRWQPLDGLTCQ